MASVVRWEVRPAVHLGPHKVRGARRLDASAEPRTGPPFQVFVNDASMLHVRGLGYLRNKNYTRTFSRSRNATVHHG